MLSTILSIVLESQVTALYIEGSSLSAIYVE